MVLYPQVGIELTKWVENNLNRGVIVRNSNKSSTVCIFANFGLDYSETNKRHHAEIEIKAAHN